MSNLEKFKLIKELNKARENVTNGVWTKEELADYCLDILFDMTLDYIRK